MQGTGKVIIQDERVSTLRCSFVFNEMPFDEQTCKLALSMPGWSSQSLQLKWVPSNAVRSRELADSEWNIMPGRDWVSGTQLVENYVSMPGFSPIVTESQIYTEFKLRRKSGSLVRQFVTPVILLYLLSYAGLWLSSAAVPARVAAGIIPALTMSNKLNALASILPPIESLTRLSSFLDLSQTLIVLHVVEYVLVSVAERRVQLFADTKKHKDQEFQVYPEDALDSLRRQTVAADCTMMRIWKFLAEYLETATRLVSPSLYACSALLILFA